MGSGFTMSMFSTYVSSLRSPYDPSPGTQTVLDKGLPMFNCVKVHRSGRRLRWMF